jgi:hypothetical protein
MATGYELAGKRLELLKDMVAGLSRVAVLSNPNNPPHVHYLRETKPYSNWIKPVALPPGRARLSAYPLPTGSIP